MNVNASVSTRRHKPSHLARVLPRRNHTCYKHAAMHAVLAPLLLAATAACINAQDSKLFFYPFRPDEDEHVRPSDDGWSQQNIPTGFPFMRDNHSTLFVSS